MNQEISVFAIKPLHLRPENGHHVAELVLVGHEHSGEEAQRELEELVIVRAVKH